MEKNNGYILSYFPKEERSKAEELSDIGVFEKKLIP